jgi:oxygen-independent coproporphyrinogen-3 oxidase
MYRLLCEETAAAGYTHYEISNLSLPGFDSRHNTKYWTRAPVFGFGCSAHSFDGARTRWSNERDVRLYIARVNTEGSARVETTTLNLEEVSAENLFLSLRLLERGVDLDEFTRKFQRDVRREQVAEIERLNDAGLIEFEGNTMRLTTRGALLSNEVFATLV